MKLYAYCRVSTENQEKDNTIDIQRQALNEWAGKNGHEIVKAFEDNGVSGSKEFEDRPGLGDLISALKDADGTIDGVLVYKLDRLARDIRIQENFIHLIKKYGVEIYSIKEPDLCGDDPTRSLLRHILGSFAQFEKSVISMRLSAGRMKKAKDEGKGYAGGRAALGYDAKNKDLVINEEGAETIKLIFSLKAAGQGLREIARKLNADNVPTAKGGTWYAGTVKYILNNPIYKGTLHYNGIENNRASLAIAA